MFYYSLNLREVNKRNLSLNENQAFAGWSYSPYNGKTAPDVCQFYEQKEEEDKGDRKTDEEMEEGVRMHGGQE